MKNYFVEIVVLMAISLFCTALKAQTYAATTVEDKEEVSLDLDSCSYELSFKIWIEPETNVNSLNTQLSNSSEKITWDISFLPRLKWVILTREIDVENPISDGRFSIEMASLTAKDVAVFYIDDISLKQKGALFIEDVESYENIEENVKIYPNPVNDLLNITSTEAFKGYGIYRVNGQHIAEESLNEKTDKTISTKFLTPGIYLLKLKNDKGVVIKFFTKK